MQNAGSDTTTQPEEQPRRMNQRAADEGFAHCQWVGADDVDRSFPIDLSDLPSEEGIIGILVHKAGAAEENLFGYSPMTRATWPGAKPDDYETDDIHTSLPELCKDYGLPLDLVVDRMAIALLRLAQAEALGKADDDA
jgi:hypothetical protein